MNGAPIIVTAVMANADFATLNALRRRYFPPERNVIDAHLTLFHHLPPSAEDELLRALQDEARAAQPVARIAGLMNLGRGVAYRIESAGLNEVRSRIAERFAGRLIPQDAGGWRPHVTVANKIAPADARVLLAELEKAFEARPLLLRGLAAWRYLGGPWEAIAGYAFGTGHRLR